MTLYTPRTLTSARIATAALRGPATAPAVVAAAADQGDIYSRRVKALLANRGFGEQWDTQPQSYEETGTDTSGRIFYRFRNFVFGDVDPDTGFAQIRDHMLYFSKSALGQWHVTGASFGIMGCGRYYPEPNKSIKIYYVLKVRGATRPTYAYVVPTGQTFAIEASYTRQQAIDIQKDDRPFEFKPVPELDFNTQVPRTPDLSGTGSTNLTDAFETIQWNLASKVEWAEITKTEI